MWPIRGVWHWQEEVQPWLVICRIADDIKRHNKRWPVAWSEYEWPIRPGAGR